MIEGVLWMHLNKRCGDDCPYCEMKRMKQRIAELEKQNETLASTIRILGIEVDGRTQKISLLEAVAEAVKKQEPNISYWTRKALKAAGYLKDE